MRLVLAWCSVVSMVFPIELMLAMAVPGQACSVLLTMDVSVAGGMVMMMRW